MCQRVHAQARGLFGLKEFQRGAQTILEPLASGDPCVKSRQCLLQRNGLAQVAAGVLVEPMQRAVGVQPADLGFIGADHPHIGQAQLARHLALVVQRFGKQHLGIDEQHRQAGGHDADHMQQHDRFRPE